MHLEAARDFDGARPLRDEAHESAAKQTGIGGRRKPEQRSDRHGQNRREDDERAPQRDDQTLIHRSPAGPRRAPFLIARVRSAARRETYRW